jgi:hypothetical protein
MPLSAYDSDLLPHRLQQLAARVEKRLITALCAVLLTAPVGALAGQFYKWTDADGNVHYGSEKPADAAVEQVRVDTSRTGVNRGADALDKLKQEADDEAQRIKEEGIPEQPPVPSLSRKEVTQRCLAAKQNLATIQSRGQLRERDDKGNTRYVSETERQQRIKHAKKQIREYCN